MKTVNISGIEIRVDEQGRYCLSDIHQAGGSRDVKRPAIFLRMLSTVAAIKVIKCDRSNYDPVASTKGRYGGTFADAGLVQSYASWVDNKFDDLFSNLTKQKCEVVMKDNEVKQQVTAPVTVDTITNTLTMTSLEIAELCGKKHSNVKRTIETLVEQKVIGAPHFETLRTTGGNNKTYEAHVYIFTLEQKRDTFVVVAQLSPKFTARLVDRWQELENQVATTQVTRSKYDEMRAWMPDNMFDPCNPDILDVLGCTTQIEKYRRRLIDMVEEQDTLIEKQAAKIETDQPKVAFYETVATIHQEITLNETAKRLGIGRNMMCEALRAMKVFMPRNRRGLGPQPYQHAINRSRFVIRTVPDHLGRPYSMTFVTGKGLIWLQENLEYIVLIIDEIRETRRKRRLLKIEAKKEEQRIAKQALEDKNKEISKANLKLIK